MNQSTTTKPTLEVCDIKALEIMQFGSTAEKLQLPLVSLVRLHDAELIYATGFLNREIGIDEVELSSCGFTKLIQYYNDIDPDSQTIPHDCIDKTLPMLLKHQTI